MDQRPKFPGMQTFWACHAVFQAFQFGSFGGPHPLPWTFDEFMQTTGVVGFTVAALYLVPRAIWLIDRHRMDVHAWEERQPTIVPTAS